MHCSLMCQHVNCVAYLPEYYQVYVILWLFSGQQLLNDKFLYNTREMALYLFKDYALHKSSTETLT